MPLPVLPLATACFILTAGCDRDEAPPLEPTVSGTVTSREPLSLPAAATLELRLARTSDDGEQDELLALQRQRNVGALPIHFTLQYAPGAVDPTRRYTVTARVLLGDDVLLKSARALPVLTRGASNHVQLELVPADPGTTGLRSGETTVVTIVPIHRGWSRSLRRPSSIGPGPWPGAASTRSLTPDRRRPRAECGPSPPDPPAGWLPMRDRRVAHGSR